MDERGICACEAKGGCGWELERGASYVAGCLRAIEKGCGYVGAALEVFVEDLRGVDESPGNAPPAEEQREKREGKVLGGRALAGTDELDGRVASEGDDHQRDALLVDDEAATALNLEGKLLRGHSRDGVGGVHEASFRFGKCTR